MHPVVFVLILAGSCLAHYRGYESRNLIERDEAHAEMEGIVECPVCENSHSWLLPQEECDIVKGNKRFKKCHMGTYLNEKCGNRLDCYRGPGESCTEKMEYDIYGQKCARGYYCNSALHVCTGLRYTVDPLSHLILSNRLYRYPLHSQNDDLIDKSAFFVA
ncbi:uncharacterized protein LOC125071187 [Vanessa atalanta]|uniref:uncharacterized protein LOC125071187 n=1 Tax=Vanessa atalanta TaxID=42275 RepID=UPI001FCD8EA8|nr:uncharacterized protein LOC125071187 [Vanessa atalanta]